LRARLCDAQNVRFLAVDGMALPFTGQEFHVISTSKVMHHIPDWEGAFAEMARVLKPGSRRLFCKFVVPMWADADPRYPGGCHP